MTGLDAPPAERLGDRQYGAIVNVVQTEVGIQLPPAKRLMVEGRLRRRVRALGLPSLDAYARELFSGGRLDRELVHLVDCVTTNKTDFFRESTHFDFLRERAVPALLAGRSGRRLKIWSAACSIGAEAYTAAMVLADMQRGAPGFDFAILGTDVSTEVLRAARRAVYSEAMVAAVPKAMRERYTLVSRDARTAEARIVPELRRRAHFEHLNLMDQRYPFDRDVDVIFCRNVLIYFDRPTQLAVVHKLTGHLRPGGFLVLGHSESMAGGTEAGLKQILPTVFQAAGTP